MYYRAAELVKLDDPHRRTGGASRPRPRALERALVGPTPPPLRPFGSFVAQNGGVGVQPAPCGSSPL